MFEGALSNLLIVDDGNGSVYFVEDKNKKTNLVDFKKPSNEEILKKSDKKENFDAEDVK